MEETQWKRPWLAVLLGTLVTGFGHIYLRRWWRALGWVLTLSVTSLLFVPTSARTALSSQVLNPGSASGSLPVIDLLPIFAIGLISVLDAYVIARMNNRQLMEQHLGVQRCHNCGRQLDPEVSFCQWCGASRSDHSESEPESESQSNTESEIRSNR